MIDRLRLAIISGRSGRGVIGEAYSTSLLFYSGCVRRISTCCSFRDTRNGKRDIFHASYDVMEHVVRRIMDVTLLMLMLFVAFLVLLVYKMDIREKEAKYDQKDSYRAGLEEGFRQGMQWGTRGDDEPQIFSIRKKKK